MPSFRRARPVGGVDPRLRAPGDGLKRSSHSIPRPSPSRRDAVHSHNSMSMVLSLVPGIAASRYQQAPRAVLRRICCRKSSAIAAAPGHRDLRQPTAQSQIGGQPDSRCATPPHLVETVTPHLSSAWPEVVTQPLPGTAVRNTHAQGTSRSEIAWRQPCV